MEKKRLELSRRSKPVIVKGDDRTSIKPGVSRDAQKKMDSMERRQRQALSRLRGKVLFD